MPEGGRVTREAMVFSSMLVVLSAGTGEPGVLAPGPQLPEAVASAESLPVSHVSPALGFDACHVQGLAVTADHFFFTSVNRSKREGWLFKIARESMDVVAKRNVAIDEDFHPGGIDFDGRLLWVPVAVYSKKSHAYIVSVAPDTLECVTRFEVDDHIGAIACAGERLIGANWDAEAFYIWTRDGRLLERRKSPTGIAYQDCKAHGAYLVCGGGGCLDWIDVADWRLVKRFPLGTSREGSPLSREGAALFDGEVYFLPDDGPSARIYQCRFSAAPLPSGPEPPVTAPSSP
ncbi:MAG: hypothetical protein JXR94_08645 [Candidatus Hydrogenedentes bacterium]|nr:hypothetical protein [Candidatus Hydrogenedentota bacterium]